jgi:hypothetical protein
VLHAILVAGDEAAGDAAVVGVLARLVQQMRVAVEALDHLRAHRRLLAQPDRRAQHQDVGRLHLLEHRGPVVALPAVLGHVGIDTDGDVEVDGAHEVDRHAVLAHDLHRDARQPLGVGLLRRPLQRAADVERAQVGEVPLALAAERLLLVGEDHG